MSEIIANKLAYQVREAAAAVGVSRSKLYELMRSGEVRAFKGGGRTLIAADELRRWVAERSDERP